jgi:signal transduction histidine kinase
MSSGMAILVGFILSRQITAPIRRLTHTTLQTTEGDWQYEPISSPPGDEIGQLEQAFSKMTARLHRAQKQRRQLIADVAHELRTPLTVISTNLEGMLDKVIPNDQRNIASTLD